MIARIRTVYGDHCHIDTDELERAQRRARECTNLDAFRGKVLGFQRLGERCYEPAVIPQSLEI
jgi:hypothetical protein